MEFKSQLLQGALGDKAQRSLMITSFSEEDESKTERL